jgi:3-hydroxyacyl-[acyl-carrier-protein] dehydratase
MTTTLIELESILAALPRRYPALLIDRLVECIPGTSARAIKGVTVNESFFQGHFPDYPVMPGVLLLEALIQLSTLLSHASGQGTPGTIREITAVRFKRQVVPGDRVTLESTMLGGGRFAVRALVEGELATEAQVLLVDDVPIARPGE